MVSKDRLLSEELDWRGLDKEEYRVYTIARLLGLAFFAALSAAFGVLAAAQVPPAPLPEPSPWRTAGQCLLATGMLAEIMVDTCLMPGATKDMEVFPLVKMAGKPVFLTTWILYCQTIEAVAAAATEVLLLAGAPCPRLMTLSYRGAVSVAGAGIILTLLFLKFNYFEEKWRTNVAELWERRGVRFFRNSLLGHIPSLPVAVLDVVLVRDRRFLAACTPSLLGNMGVTFTFAVSWYSWVHILWWATGYRCWPYPFLHLFDTIPKRLAFFAVVYSAMVLFMLPMQLAA